MFTLSTLFAKLIHMQAKPYHHGDLEVEIIKTAIKRASLLGPAGLNIREIARELGVSAPAIYRHFSNREALIIAIKLNLLEKLADNMELEIKKEGVALGISLEETKKYISAIGKGYVTYGLDEPGLFRTTFFCDNAIGFLVLEHFHKFTAKAYLLLQAGVKDLVRLRLIPDNELEMYCSILWSQVHGLTTLLIDNNIQLKDKNQLDYLISSSMDTIINGIIKK